MKCALTGKTGKFVKSHIIPKSFFYINKSNDGLVIQNQSYIRPKRAPIGIYDTQLLIEEGENYFQKLDNYGFKILIEKRNKYRDFSFAPNKMGKALYKDEYDYNKLKIFLLSILWRASVSTRTEYRQVNLGKKYEEIIKNIIINNKLYNDEFEVSLLRFDHPAFKKGTILFPIRTKKSNLNYYKIYLSEYIALIKVDNRNSRHNSELLTIQKNKDLCIYNYEYEKSKEKKIIEKIMDKKESSLPIWFKEKSKI